jgi:predicted nucleic acid-binding protein
MTLPVCVDASFVLKLFLEEPDSEQVQALWTQWVAEESKIFAPSHLAFEVVAVIRNHVLRGLISAAAGRAAVEAFVAQEIELIPPEPLCIRAWELAEQFSGPTAYDSFYLAAAEQLGCDLWTADGRLYRAVQAELPWVKRLGGGS